MIAMLCKLWKSPDSKRLILRILLDAERIEVSYPAPGIVRFECEIDSGESDN